jgi:HAD superfamily hydrolase (TIGR01509 family)
MRPVKAVVFDLDGTLMDSKIDYEKMGNRIRELLVSRGLPEPLEDRRKVYRVISGGAATLREYGLPEASLEATMAEMETIMNDIELEALDAMELKPYARTVVAELHGKGIGLGVATRSHREYTLRGLKRYDMMRFFHHVVARDDVPYPKPDPRHLLYTIRLLGVDPGDTLFIGDTTTDLQTADAAGVEFIGYWRDESWAQRLMEGGCSRIVKDLREIPRLVKERA